MPYWGQIQGNLGVDSHYRKGLGLLRLKDSLERIMVVGEVLSKIWGKYLLKQLNTKTSSPK